MFGGRISLVSRGRNASTLASDCRAAASITGSHNENFMGNVSNEADLFYCTTAAKGRGLSLDIVALD